MIDKHPVMRRAIEIAGSQARLAELTGISQSQISRMLEKKSSIQAENAVLIERATRIPKHEIRPDLWSEPFITQDGNRIERISNDQSVSG